MQALISTRPKNNSRKSFAGGNRSSRPAKPSEADRLRNQQRKNDSRYWLGL